ncbi:MAG: hydrogenase maturation peptidase HycI [Methanobrevibacter sp.]|nr:hydrogenase maturation peptidase HycI [Methanobrevibacter sp.]MEE0901989.1 hydrogenase maturation peptidase HycI [Methanobrevibacter sp.]MEE0934381.1 hydrogenase maturation peptidase HycI [Methanobrevibacter sp.]
MSFKSQLGNFLDGCEKLIILGVGNELKCDDGVGPYIINKLKDENIEDKKKLLFIDAKTVPENFTGKIRKEKPTHLIIVDACLMDEEPGTMKIVNKYDFASIGISTHSMSLSFFVRYLERDTEFRIIFVGIEPESMDYADNPTAKVAKAADEFVNILKEIIL